MTPTLSGVDKRLQHRYELLVQEHTGQAHASAAGPRTLPSPASAKAHAQAAWRFFRNHGLAFPQLMCPLIQLARCHVADASAHYGLVVHDWSGLDFSSHTAKTDRIVLRKDGGVGYELYSALLLADRSGQPIAPLRLRLRSQDGLYDSACRRRTVVPVHLDGLRPVLRYLRGLRLGRPLVHLIDAEGDSVYHLRQWHQAGHLFVVRTDDQRVVRHEEVERTVPAVVQLLQQRQAFRLTREVSYQGQKAWQYVAEAPVVLARPSWRHRMVDGRRRRIVRVGPPLPVRLVVSEVRAADGSVLARWQLLTNAAAEVTAATVALWYYWRWQVESYFKLLKAAGQQLEHWLQETAEAILKRLLVASMACALVWRLARSAAPQAATARRLLMRLSGRQVVWGREYTEEALLAGLWVLLALGDVLEENTPKQLQKIADFILTGSDTS
jgi:hypothetical protein